MLDPTRAAVLALAVTLAACAVPADADVEPSRSEDDLVVSRCCSSVQPGALPIVRFDGHASYTLTTPAGDIADVHYPTDRLGRFFQRLGVRHPVVVLLQGAQTDKAAYAGFAGLVAEHGFVVVVPNHFRAFPPGAPASLFTEQGVIADGLAAAVAESRRASSPLEARIDETRLAVVGHSFGGVAAILGVAGTCAPPFCTPGTYTRPAALRAAVVFGTNYTDGEPRAALPVDTSAAPIAMVQGTVDGRSLPSLGALTYAELEAPKAYVELEGVNHFGITDTVAPPGAVPDANASTVPQEEAVARAATWTSLFLRATVSNDPIARAYVRSAGSFDGTVKVQSTP